MQDDIFIEIYKKYHVYVYRYLMGLTSNHQTAEDLTQETFVKALCVLQSPGTNIKAWLLTVAHNLYVDHVKKSGRLDYKNNDFFNSMETGDFSNKLVEQENNKRLLTMIANLPENQRQALLLCVINGLTHIQAAKILGISVSSVTNLIYRARKTLRAERNNNE
ncbi:RNA polymerase sigma factor [Alkalibacter mobilis]|uniref:RNA polymerase sigma factor n=1 Tax=Alkalibacter mobilis TaxID=2787712 RepID=UPI0018A0BC36|nr:RNA polymerase sigma factor [Alkalibacter mobilis]MBF7095643.1 RNA polymerase sigma factor [Alkalibacter mobilis]